LGDLYVGGTTNSPNFPTASPVQAAFGGSSPTCNATQEPCGDGFITEINASGTAPFVFSTYLGGSGDDGISGLTLDNQQNILVTGFTASPNFPITPGVAQTKCGTDGNCNALSDAFVAKIGLPVFKGPYALGEVFAATGLGLVDVFKPDGTFLGAMDTTQNQSAGMVFDKTGNLYVTNFCSPQAVSKFDSNANLVGTFGSGFSSFQNCPESILFDQAGNAFVGAATFTYIFPPPSPLVLSPIFEFNAAGTAHDLSSAGGRPRD
jgi:DNA-binding beta-propeller fold protein YncE